MQFKTEIQALIVMGNFVRKILNSISTDLLSAVLRLYGRSF